MPHSDHSRQHVVNTANYNRGTRLYDPIPSSLYIYIRSFSNRLFCTYVIHDQLMFQSICVCGSRRGGELQRSVCRNSTLSSPEAEYCYIIRDLASRPMLSSPHSSLLTLLRLYSAPHKCTVLSGCPGRDAHQAPGCWTRRWICPRTHQYLSPGPGGETLLPLTIHIAA